MNKPYYIELITKDSRNEWLFETNETRNEIYQKVVGKFNNYKSSEIPFIEVDVGDYKNLGRITLPLRLNNEVKNEVIEYINSLV